MAPLPRLAPLLLPLLVVAVAATQPPPPVWPERFSAVLFQNRSGVLALTELHYDHARGANLNVIRPQLGGSISPDASAALGGGGAVFDLELDTGDSFVWRTAAPPGAAAEADAHARVLWCERLKFDVGILRPDWLSGARNLGRTTAGGGFVADVYEKADFIRYYAEAPPAAADDEGEGEGGGGGSKEAAAANPGANEDGERVEEAEGGVGTPSSPSLPLLPYRRRPVRWTFLETGADFWVLEYAVGADARPVPGGAWKPPKECFSQEPAAGADEAADLASLPPNVGRIWRLPTPSSVAVAAS